ncbi:MAG: hypothetical protein GTN49_11630 [candidate division Zixibacteria bacterium]|nr:hypothetical protein [candidate division Zixibacteria bacterium]
MALGRLVAPGPDPFLTAASVINIAAALGVLALMYYWARPRLGRWAPLAVAMVAASSQYPLLAAMPLCEMVYLLFILAAVATAARGTGWTYLWAGAAAATRYEALALIPLVAVCDIPNWPRRPRLVLYALLALVPAGGWLLAGYLKTGSPNPYVDEIEALTASGWAFPRELATSFFGPTKPALWVVTGAFAAVTLIGLVRIAARGRPGERVFLAFALIYTLIHVIFPFSYRRFVFPIWPVMVLGFLEGGGAVSSLGAKIRTGRSWYIVAGVLFGALAVGLAWRLGISRAGSAVTLFFAGVVPLAALAACAWWGFLGERFSPGRWAALAAVIVALALFADSGVNVFRLERESMRYYRASLKSAASWLARAAGPTDVVVSTDRALFGYYFGPAGPRASWPGAFRTADFALFTARARRVGVSYVCYDSLSGADPGAYFAMGAGAALLQRLRVGRDVGPDYYFIAKVETPGEYVYIYRLAAEPPGWVPPKWPDEEEEG